MPASNIHVPFYKQKKFWIIVSCLAVVALLVFLYKSEKYAFINSKVKNLVAEKTDRLYKVTYDSLKVDEIAGNVFIKNLTVTGDTLLQDRYIKAGDTSAASMLVDVTVSSLQIVGFKTAAALLSKELSCDKIIIMDPRITLNLYPGQSSHKDQLQEQSKQLYKRILGNLHLIQADSVVLINAEVVALNHYTKEIKFHTFNTSIFLKDVLIDSLHYNDTTRTLFSKQVALHSDKLILGEKPVVAEVTNLTFDTKSGILALSNISHPGLKNGKDFNGIGEDLVITGLQATGSMEALNIAIDKASIAKLKIELEQKHDNGKSTGNKQTSTPILNGWIKSFSIANIAAGDVAVNMYAPAEKKQVFSFNKNALVISNFKLDTTATMDGSLLKTAEDVVLKNDLITFKSKDNLYTYACKGLTVRLRGKSISLKEFAIQPMLAEQAFANKAVVQKDRYDVQVRNITLTGVDFEKALNGGLSVDKITASNNSLKIYRDISKPLDSISKVGNSPHQLLYKLKLPIAINKLIATNTLIQFKERNGLSDTSGSISFANSVIQIDNIINHVKPGKSIMNFNMSGKFIGQVPVDVNIRFYLDRFRDGYTEIAVKSAHHFNGTILNKSIEPMGLVRIDRGNIYSLDANLTTDNYYARGKFTMQYDDLKLTLLKRKKQSGNFKKRDILSLIANVVVKNSNPKNGNLRTANVNFRRNDYKSFFNMIWKFAFTAIKDVMGAKL